MLLLTNLLFAFSMWAFDFDDGIEEWGVNLEVPAISIEWTDPLALDYEPGSESGNFSR